MLRIFRNVVLSVALAAVVQIGCTKSAYYPGYVSPCVEAKQVREQARQAQGDEKAMLEVKAQGLEEACRSSMNNKHESDKINRKPGLF
jgi:hypothetical protein